jgi:hypothetical protein
MDENSSPLPNIIYVLFPKHCRTNFLSHFKFQKKMRAIALLRGINVGAGAGKGGPPFLLRLLNADGADALFLNQNPFIVLPAGLLHLRRRSDRGRRLTVRHLGSRLPPYPVISA